MKFFVYRYIWILVSILIGVVCVAPYLVTYFLVPALSEEKLHYFYQDAEPVYLARIREALEGHVQIASPIFYEYKNEQNVQLPFGEWLYGIFMFGDTDLLVPLAMASKFFLPTLLSVLIFVFVGKLLQRTLPQASRTNKFVALFLSVFVLLGVEFNNPGYWRQVFAGDGALLQLSMWTRLVNPITGAIGLFFVCYMLCRVEERYTSVRVIGLGLVLGLMSGYFFSFALGLLIIGGMMVFAFLERRWEHAQALFLALVIALLINFSYLQSILFGEVGAETMLKSGLLLTHNALHNKILYLSGLLLTLYTGVLVWIYRSLRPVYTNSLWQWGLVLTLAGLIGLNQQVITGKTVWPGHFVQYTNPLSYIVMVTMIYVSISLGMLQKQGVMFLKFQRWVRYGSVVGIIFIFIVNIYTTLPAFRAQPIYADSQRYTLPLGWLREHGGSPCVVFVFEKGEWLEKYIPAYTQCDLYHSAYVFSAIPPERVLHNYIVYLRILGVAPEDITAYLDKHEGDVHRFFFEDWVDLFPYNGDEWLFGTKSPEARAAFLPKYKAIIAEAYKSSFDKSLNVLLKQYRVDYILYDASQETLGPEAQRYEETFRGGELVILKVKN